MSKVRVYELAKEFGIENKEFIAKLKTLGIAVKSHSSTLEDSEVERVRREFASKGEKEVVEKRVKSTVFRRRAVRLPAEEAAEAEEAKPVKKAKAKAKTEKPAKGKKAKADIGVEGAEVVEDDDEEAILPPKVSSDEEVPDDEVDI